ncbi:hypothetical protein ABMA28_007337 [Loxostege sticticalis]|uniref:Uncharacterized protein n=1 Tax=Loxostege sticticalis TaxID=481309 RepID=A0ABD0TQD0_LOXSC
MYKSRCTILMLFLFFVISDAKLPEEECKKKPTEANCIKEPVDDLVGYHRRYVYNWDGHECFEILWSDSCPSVPDPPTRNLFMTKGECLEYCG